jgi:formamidopyrimidine-DNA glycosylase
MPELPEVETISKGLNKVLKGKSFSKIRILDKKVVKGDLKKLIGFKIRKIYRKAKLVIFEFEKNQNIIIHLKMTGQLIYQKTGIKNHELRIKKKIAGGHQSEELCLEMPNKHTRVIFQISDNAELYFNDMRRFGWIKNINNENLKELFEKEYGVEPFSKEFNLKTFNQILKNSKSSNIKKVLMDQKKIVGIGNMYADEALFLAKVDPRRKAISIKRNETEKLLKSIKKVLEQGIINQGASIKNYLTCEGKKGKAHEFFKVYNHVGEKCKCGGIIEKIKLNGRGTHFCPACQH